MLWQNLQRKHSFKPKNLFLFLIQLILYDFNGLSYFIWFISIRIELRNFSLTKLFLMLTFPDHNFDLEIFLHWINEALVNITSYTYKVNLIEVFEIRIKKFVWYFNTNDDLIASFRKL